MSFPVLCRCPTFAVLAGSLLLLATCPLFAQLPATRLGSVVPSGGTPGSTFDVTIGGEDLDDVAGLHFSHPAIAAKPKMAEPGPFDQGPQVVPNQFVVSVPAGTPLGIYEVRAQGKYGLSNPRAFTVGDVPETVEIEPNDTAGAASAVTIPVVVNGISDRNGDVDHFKFTATAGQRILALALGRNADSRMDPVVAVFDAAGRELGSHRGHQGRNALVDFTAPANGEYTVRIHDAVYQGGRDYFYRLSIGVLPYLDCVIPLAGAAGSSGPFTLLGATCRAASRRDSRSTAAPWKS